jgi:hypothetical protein
MADGLEARIDRVEANLDRLVGVVTTLAENVVRMSDTIIRLEEGQRRNDETIGALVRMMDEWIRKQPAPVIFQPFGEVR